MYRYRAANDKQYYRDKWIAAIAIFGFVFLMGVLSVATGSLVPAVVITLVMCFAK